jgi:hypothetical protein
MMVKKYDFGKLLLDLIEDGPLSRVLERLGVADLMMLRLACIERHPYVNRLPCVKHRLVTINRAMRCARHWLFLSQRVYANVDSPPPDKHRALQTLRTQVTHINDVAALVFHMSAAVTIHWECHNRDVEVPEVVDAPLRRLMTVLGIPATPGSDLDVTFQPFISCGDGHWYYHMEFHDHQLFLYALVHLKTLSAEAVLRRIHGYFSRQSRSDLILLSRVLDLELGRNPLTATEYETGRHVREQDIWLAFASAEPSVRDIISRLTPAQRARLTAQLLMQLHGVYVDVL